MLYLRGALPSRKHATLWINDEALESGIRCNVGSVQCSGGQINRPLFQPIFMPDRTIEFSTFLSSPFRVELALLSLLGTSASNGAAARQIERLRD